MAEDLKTTSDNSPPTSNDIAFECPMCGKSMVVSADGAGEVILCPSCDQEVIVPGGPLWDEVMSEIKANEEAAASEASQYEEETPPAEENQPSLSELKERIRTLENQLKENESQRVATAESITQALNQATRYKYMLQRLEEKHLMLKEQVDETKKRIEAHERLA